MNLMQMIHSVYSARVENGWWLESKALSLMIDCKSSNLPFEDLAKFYVALQPHLESDDSLNEDVQGKRSTVGRKSTLFFDWCVNNFIMVFCGRALDRKF